jgi:hypothetical protein
MTWGGSYRPQLFADWPVLRAPLANRQIGTFAGLEVFVVRAGDGTRAARRRVDGRESGRRSTPRASPAPWGWGWRGGPLAN